MKLLKPFPANERGAILVTALLLLLTLTIIGVSVVQMTRMQERMAGNARDLNLAFQGSEAALREGEQQIFDALNRPSNCTATPCAVFQLGFLPVLNNQTAAWWAANAQEYASDGVRDLPELAQDPQFTVEELGFVRDSLVDPLDGRDFYQVTARSTGGTGNANVVIQTTFARRF